MHDTPDCELTGPDLSLLDDENPDIRKEIIETIGEQWLHTKNVMLDDRTPEELINTPEEVLLRDMLRSFVICAPS